MIKYLITSENVLVNFSCKEINSVICDKIKIEVDNIIGSKNIKNIIFDFKNISFIDFSVISMIIGRYNIINKKGGNMLVINANEKVNKTFELVNLNRIIKIN